MSCCNYCESVSKPEIILYPKVVEFLMLIAKSAGKTVLYILLAFLLAIVVCSIFKFCWNNPFDDESKDNKRKKIIFDADILSIYFRFAAITISSLIAVVIICIIALVIITKV